MRGAVQKDEHEEGSSFVACLNIGGLPVVTPQSPQLRSLLHVPLELAGPGRNISGGA